MNKTRKLLASAAVLVPAALAIAPSVAHATPYAFADNQITHLTVTYSDGTPLTSVASATTNISDLRYSVQMANFRFQQGRPCR